MRGASRVNIGMWLHQKVHIQYTLLMYKFLSAERCSGVKLAETDADLVMFNRSLRRV